METVVEAGVVVPLCQLLECEDPRIQEVVLDGMLNLLCAMEEKVEQLCHDIENSGGRWIGWSLA